MKSITTLSSAALLAAVTLPAWATPPTPTTDQLQEISNCEIMAKAVQKFAEARDQHLSKPDAFKTVTNGQADVPGSLVDETLQWAFNHPREEPETVSDHFQERCELDALDLLTPIADLQIQADATRCQHDHEGKPDDIRTCINGKLTAIVDAGGVPAPAAPAALTAETAVAASAPPAGTASVIESAQAPAATVSAVASAPTPVVASAPTTTVASAPAPSPAAAPAPIVPVAATPAALAPALPSRPAPVVASAPMTTVASAPAPVVAAPTPTVAAVSPTPAPRPVAVKPAPAPAPISTPLPAASALTVAGTHPPSQPGIGKLVLGMPLAEAAKLFDSYGDRDEDADGSPNISYMVSDDHGYVVLLTEPGKPDTIYGVEIHGGADAKLEPVMGVRLGDGALSLMTHIGEPSSRTPIPKSDNTLWSYNDRNYSFEVSSGGDVITIRVEGYTSLPQTDAPAAATDP